jgi:gamma-glutamylcyclotransferase (GGCT)/AIG2-like uncharacterized protein YtfP
MRISNKEEVMNVQHIVNSDSDVNTSTRVFVYGTLKQGFTNHGLLSRFVCLHRACWVYGKLYDTGWGYPALHDVHQASQQDVISQNKVYGELYEAQPEVLRQLDRLEGYMSENHPQNLYQRVYIKVYGAEGFTEDAQTYVFARTITRSMKWIASGNWQPHHK